MQISTIRSIGNSSGLIIPSSSLKRTGFSLNNSVVVSEENGNIIISPANKRTVEMVNRFDAMFTQYDSILRSLNDD